MMLTVPQHPLPSISAVGAPFQCQARLREVASQSFLLGTSCPVSPSQNVDGTGGKDRSYTQHFHPSSA